MLAGLQDHPAEPRVHRQPGQLSCRCRSAAVTAAGPARARPRRAPPAAGCRPSMLRASGGSTNGKSAMSPRSSAAIRRMTEARLVRRISGLGELGPGGEVVLGVQPDADAVRGPPAAARALAGRGLRDRLDRQPLHLGPVAVARDPGGAGVDDVADAGDGQRGLGDVGGQHHPAPAGSGRRLARTPGAARPRTAGRTAAGPPGRPAPAQRVGGVPDLPLAAEEDQDVARPVPRQLGRPRPGCPAPGPGARGPGRPGRPAAGSAPRPGRCGRTPR